jgi:lipoprotein NlpD
MPSAKQTSKRLIGRLFRRLPAGSFLPVLVLTGCLAENYQAPMSDQSEVMDQSGPEIVTSSDDSPSRYGSDTVRPASSVADGAVAQVARPSVHRVASGESLYAIAFQYDLDARSLATVNNLTPPYTLFVGQELSLELNNQTTAAGAGETAVASVGRVVGNNSVARAQAASTTPRGVIRQPLTRAPLVSEEPQWQWPVRGQVLTNFQADTSARKGIDIGAVAGQPIHAAAAGEVVYAGNGIQGSGNLIIIRHDERLLSAYAQNRAMLVAEGQQVRAGDQIAEAGTNVEGVPLVHFEIRLDGKPVDPLGYLPRQ